MVETNICVYAHFPSPHLLHTPIPLYTHPSHLTLPYTHSPHPHPMHTLPTLTLCTLSSPSPYAHSPHPHPMHTLLTLTLCTLPSLLPLYSPPPPPMHTPSLPYFSQASRCSGTRVPTSWGRPWRGTTGAASVTDLQLRTGTTTTCYWRDGRWIKTGLKSGLLLRESLIWFMICSFHIMTYVHGIKEEHM